MDKDKISVIVPVYNTKEYIEDCVKSILSQTYKKIELILVDDGSTDGSADICDMFKRFDKRVIVVHKRNEGVSAARNDGLNIASGEYFAFVDSDDIIEPNMYELLIKSIQENRTELAMCKIKCGDKIKNIKYDEVNINNLNGQKLKNLFLKQNYYEKPGMKILDGAIWSANRYLFKFDLIGETQFQNLKSGEDLIFLLDYIKNEYKISVVDEYLYLYVQRDNSLSHFYNPKILSYKKDFIRTFNNKKECFSDKCALKAFYYWYYFTLIRDVSISNNVKYKAVFSIDEFKNLSNAENYREIMRIEKNRKKRFLYFLCKKRMFNLLKFLYRHLKKTP